MLPIQFFLPSLTTTSSEQQQCRCLFVFALQEAYFVARRAHTLSYSERAACRPANPQNERHCVGAGLYMNVGKWAGAGEPEDTCWAEPAMGEARGR